jgi:hypothetical protein
MSTDLYITKKEFDWEYYLTRNPDLIKAGVNTLDKCHRHWVTYGCYENRWVKSLSGQEHQVKLNTNEKFKLTHSPVLEGIDLKFKIALMIHIFDATMIRFFTSYINRLNQTYVCGNFDIYFNIAEENNPYHGALSLRQYVTEQLEHIKNPHVKCVYNENRGGDIGGFLILSKEVIRSGIDYKYAIFVHSKKNLQWRIDLCRCLFDLQFENLDKNKNFGLISANKWIYMFDPINQVDEYNRFKYHLIDLCHIYELSCNHKWSFIAGTMFLAKIEIIKYLVLHEVDQVYHMLNRPDSIDVNWMAIVEEQKKDAQGVCNDFQYRLKYGHPLLSDYMIEHTFERVIGLICDHLGYRVIGTV